MRRPYNLATRLTGLACMVALCGGGLALDGLANVQGILVQKKDGRRLAGTIRWQEMTKSYVISAGNRSMTLPADQIERVEVPKPPTMDAAIASIRGGNAAAAIVPLEKILREYHMLQWDIEAARWLAQVYLNMNKADRAIMLCERVIKSNPAAAYSGDLSGIYWQALIKADRDAKLGSILDKAVQQGSRELAARALIARGDILRKNRKLKEALVDGYLRTVILFEQVKSAQPEALAKAASCFEAQGDTANAERMRKKLLASYPDSPFARQMK